MEPSLDNVKIYYINLDRAPERRESIERQAKEHGITIERITAVDGRTLDSATLTRYDSMRRRKEFLNDLSINEHACTLSHLKALETLIASKADYGIILEDDAILHPDFKNGISWLTQKVSGWKVIKLYTAVGKLYPLNCSADTDCPCSLVFPKQLPWVAVGNLYTREGAIEMLKCFERYWLSYDAQWGWYLMTRNIPVAGISPSLVNTSDANNQNSTIDDGGNRYATTAPQSTEGSSGVHRPTKRTLGQYLLHRFSIWRVAAGKLNQRIMMRRKLRVSK